MLEAIPEELFPRISAWLDKRDDAEIHFDDLKAYLLKEFTLSISARAQKLLSMAKQPLGDMTALAA